MASPSLAFSEKDFPRSDKYFRVPNEFAEHQAAFIPAERALALVIFRQAINSRGVTDWNGTARFTDSQWTEWTGLQPRMKEQAARGLQAKGLEITRKSKNSAPEFSWNWNKWNNAFANPEPSAYDPGRKERDAKAAAKKVHPDCATGCAKLRELQQANITGTNQETPFFVTSIAQPVARSPKQTIEEKWAKTLSAMRSQFASAGVDLLMRLLHLVWAIAILKNVSDYVLGEAVKEAYTDSRGRWNSPILLLKTVPEVLKGWKAKGQPMDDTGDPDNYTYLSERGKHPPGDPKPRMSPGDERLINRMVNVKKILDLADKGKK